MRFSPLALSLATLLFFGCAGNESAQPAGSDADATSDGDAIPGVDGTSEVDATPNADGSSDGDAEASPVTCSSGFTNCSNRCIDVSSDTSNCGRCDHDCLGGACADGVCQPIVLAKTTTLDHPGYLLADDSLIYFTYGFDVSKSGIAKLPIGGGTPVSLLSGESYINRFAANAATLYWSEYGSSPGVNGLIGSLPKAGGTSSTLLKDLRVTTTIAVDATYLYYGTQSWSIFRRALSGGTPQDLFDVTGSYDAITLTLDSTNIYLTLTAPSPGGSVRKLPLAGGAATTLVASENNPTDLAVDDKFLYYVSFGSKPDFVDGKIWKVPIGGGTPTVLATDQCKPEDLKVDSGFVYWATYCGGTIAKVPIAGGPVKILAAAQTGPNGVFLTEKAVFWTNYLGYEIMKVAK